MGTDISSHSLTQIYFSTLFPSHASHLQHGFASQFEVGILRKNKKKHAFDQENKEDSRKKVRYQDLDHAIDQEKKSSFQILGFFFYKFKPLADSRLIAKGSQKDDKRIAD